MRRPILLATVVAFCACTAPGEPRLEEFIARRCADEHWPRLEVGDERARNIQQYDIVCLALRQDDRVNVYLSVDSGSNMHAVGMGNGGDADEPRPVFTEVSRAGTQSEYVITAVPELGTYALYFGSTPLVCQQTCSVVTGWYTFRSARSP